MIEVVDNTYGGIKHITDAELKKILDADEQDAVKLHAGQRRRGSKAAAKDKKHSRLRLSARVAELRGRVLDFRVIV